MKDFDACIIGSGAGAGPVALELARAGQKVVVLEKGPWLKEQDFPKDELAECRRSRLTPDLHQQPHAVDLRNDDGTYNAWPTFETGWDFWNGSLVGGASNLMSGYFHRMKPVDFRLRSELGPVEGANVVDWPFTYDDLEPFYARVEQEVGVSGRVAAHPFADRRSTPDLPYPPLVEHPISSWIDRAGQTLGLHPFQVPRAILPFYALGRVGCSYSRFCGNYGCATGAKGSSRAAWLDRAVATGNCEIRPGAFARKLATNAAGHITHVEYTNPAGAVVRVDARQYVVACQPVETCRLLLSSSSGAHPNGLGNRAGQVGKNLLFSTAAWARSDLPYARFSAQQVEELRDPNDFINRAVMDFYVHHHPQTGARRKGGLLEFMFVHNNPTSRAAAQVFSSPTGLLWGRALQDRLVEHFQRERHLMFEVFADWLPHDNCFVSLSPTVRDAWGFPSASVRPGKHPHNKEVADHLVAQGTRLLEALGGQNIYLSSRGAPATNLVAGGCRAGVDPQTSVLTPECRSHEVDNLWVTDGSFMPTGGSVPYTFTIYANALRVAGHILRA